MPINEFAARDAESSSRVAVFHDVVEVETDAVELESEAEDWDVDESALLDDGEEISFAEQMPVSRSSREEIAESPSPSLRDEPLQAIEEMLRSIEQPPPVEPEPLQPSQPEIQRPPASPRPKTVPVPTISTAKVVPRPEPAARQSVVVTRQQVSVSQLKQERIVQLLKQRDCDGLLLTRPANIAWYADGAELPRRFDGEPAAALLMTAKGGTLLARAADREYFLKRLPPNFELQHHECDWPNSSRDLLAKQVGLNKLASDQPFETCAEATADVADLRLPLLPLEIKNLRKLGIRVARTIERAAREFARGDTEAQIAGDVASRLIRHEVVPVRIQVWGDGRGSGCQNWNYGRDSVNHECTISVIARRYGLHVAVSRTVSFGVPSKERRWSFLDMLLAHGTALANSRDQRDVSAVWGEVARVCESLGESEAWRTIDPGCVAGYELCEAPISDSSKLRLRAGMPLIWRTMIGSARAVDTVLVRESDCKVLTQTGEWPQTSVTVNDQPFFVNTLLQRS